MGKDPREMMTLMVVEKYDVNLILLFAFDLLLLAILDEIRVCVYNVLIGPGIISLYNR